MIIPYGLQRGSPNQSGSSNDVDFGYAYGLDPEERGLHDHRGHRHLPPPPSRRLGSRDFARVRQEVDATPGVKACHKQDVFIDRIQRALGVRIGEVHCHLVEPSAMPSIMGKHGWNRDDARGVVGFQVQNDIYVLTTTPWTVLHELVHKAGINADRMSRYVAEGLTEAIASDLKQSPDEHQPTYPDEVGWVRNTLLPLLGMNAIQLGRILAPSPEPRRKLAELIVAARARKGLPALDHAKLLDDLQPQRPGRPSFNRDLRADRAESARRATENGWALGVGTAFLTAGAILLFATQAPRSPHD